jgi:hypothetical protein
MAQVLSNKVSLFKDAFDAGILAKERGRLRVSPYYNERVQIRGKRIEITNMLTTAWLAGYDGEQYPDAVPIETPATVS